MNTPVPTRARTAPTTRARWASPLGVLVSTAALVVSGLVAAAPGAQAAEASLVLEFAESPVEYGHTTTATVTAQGLAPGADLCAGTISLVEGTEALAATPECQANVVTVTVPALTLGEHSIVARFTPGSSPTPTVVADSVPQILSVLATPWLELSAPPGDTPWGDTVTVTATLTSPSHEPEVPAGTVEFQFPEEGTGTWKKVADMPSDASPLAVDVRPPSAGTWQVRAVYRPSPGANHASVTALSPEFKVIEATPVLTLTPPEGAAHPGKTEHWTLDVDKGQASTTWQGTEGVCTVSDMSDTGVTVTYLSRSSHVPPRCTVTAGRTRDPGHTTPKQTDDYKDVLGLPTTLTLAHVTGTVQEPTLLRFRVADSDGGALVPGTGTVTIGHGSSSEPVWTSGEKHWNSGAKAFEFVPTKAGNHWVNVHFEPTDRDRDVMDVDPSFDVVKSDWAFEPPTPDHTWPGQVWIPDLTQPAGGSLTVEAGDTNEACTIHDTLPLTVTFDKVGTCHLTFTKPYDDNHEATAKDLTVQVQAQPTRLTVVSSADTRRVGEASKVRVSLLDALDQPLEFLDDQGQRVPKDSWGKFRACPSDESACVDARVDWTGNVAELTFTPARALPHTIELEPGAGWSPLYADPDKTAGISVERGIPTIVRTLGNDPILEAGRPWELSWSSPSDGTMKIAVTGVCSNSDPLPGQGGAFEPVFGSSPLEVGMDARERGECWIEVTQTDTADWLAPTLFAETLHVESQVTILAPLLPDGFSPEVDRRQGVPEQTIHLQATTPSRAAAGGMVPVHGSWEVTLIKPNGSSRSLVTDFGTDFKDGRLPLPIDDVGLHQLAATFTPSDTRWARRTTTYDFTAALRSQSLSLTAPSDPKVGDSWELDLAGVSPAIATHEEAGHPDARTLSVTASPRAVCSVNGRVVTWVSAGNCTITGELPGTRVFERVSASLSNIRPTRNEVTLGLSVVGVPRVGSPTQVTASLDPTAGTPARLSPPKGRLTLTIKSAGVKAVTLAPVAVTTGTTRVSWLPASAGEITVLGVFEPEDPDTWNGARRSGSTTVARADSTTRVMVKGGSAVATISSNGGPRTGTVEFVSRNRAGRTLASHRAQAVKGRATWPNHGLGVSIRGTVTARFTGNRNLEPSAAQPVRRGLPRLTARVVPTRPASNGWYRAPVTVRFTCVSDTGDIVGRCPAPVRLSSDGPRRTASATVTTTDGARVRVTSSPVRIDTTRPTLRLVGARNGAWYRGRGPATRCVADDATSGLASCRMKWTKVNDRLRKVTATASDRAGNAVTRSVRYQVFSEWVDRVPVHGTLFTVDRGRAIKVMARTSGPRPQLMMPRGPGKRPTVNGPVMGAVSIENGVVTWTTTYRVPRAVPRGAVLQLGVKTRNAKLRIVRVRVR